jgi:hypothetical protein
MYNDITRLQKDNEQNLEDISKIKDNINDLKDNISQNTNEKIISKTIYHNCRKT